MASRIGSREHAGRCRFSPALSLLLSFAAGSAVAQDGPPLEPPIAGSAIPPAGKPVEAPKPVASAVKPDENRPLLVIPGVTAPVPPRPDQPTRINSVPVPPPQAASPELTGPAAAPDRPATRPPITLSLEPIDEEEARIEEKRTKITKPRPSGTTDVPARGKTPAPPPPRTEGFLSRIFASPASRAAQKAEESSITVEPRSDPATESAVKRRVEEQVRQQLGDRVKSLEVRVVGRTVHLSARAMYFWQRRTVRRTLESLQLPAGYQVRVERVD